MSGSIFIYGAVTRPFWILFVGLVFFGWFCLLLMLLFLWLLVFLKGIRTKYCYRKTFQTYGSGDLTDAGPEKLHLQATAYPIARKKRGVRKRMNFAIIKWPFENLYLDHRTTANVHVIFFGLTKSF